jgi:hypothetical protein
MVAPAFRDAPHPPPSKRALRRYLWERAQELAVTDGDIAAIVAQIKERSSGCLSLLTPRHTDLKIELQNLRYRLVELLFYRDDACHKRLSDYFHARKQQREC